MARLQNRKTKGPSNLVALKFGGGALKFGGPKIWGVHKNKVR